MYKTYNRIGQFVDNLYTPRLQGSTSVDHALEVMDQYNVDVIGVECENDFVGLFSRHDFENKVLRWNLHPSDTSLYEAIIIRPPYVTPDLTLRETYNAMLAYQVDFIPVIEGNILLGIADMKKVRAHIDRTRQTHNSTQSVSPQPTQEQQNAFLPRKIAAGEAVL